MYNRLYLKDIFENVGDIMDLLKTIRTDFGLDSDNNYLLWKELTEQELESLSCDYYFRSRYKLTTAFPRAVWEDTEDSSVVLNVMAQLITTRFGSNLKSVYDVYFKELYKPLENYSMIEERTPDLTRETDSDVDTKSTTTTDNKDYGFNSSTAVPTSESVSTTEGEKAYNKAHAKTTEKGKDTLTRSGNIGVTTSQQMLQSELELRKYDYWNFVFNCIDVILVRSYFAH